MKRRAKAPKSIFALRKVKAGKVEAKGSAPNSNGANPVRVRAILKKLDEAYPAASCALKHENAFQLLISTILSAQCTD
jgi:endonuclease-3